MIFGLNLSHYKPVPFYFHSLNYAHQLLSFPALMTTHHRDIVFNLVYLDEVTKVETYEGEFRNLMVLINEKLYVEDFGECKGIGRCGTCLIEVEGLNSESLELDRNERSTLQKCAVKGKNLRLSCQVMINNVLHNATITIIEEREDVR